MGGSNPVQSPKDYKKEPSKEFGANDMLPQRRKVTVNVPKSNLNAFANKLNDMFKNQGPLGGRRRVTVGMPHSMAYGRGGPSGGHGGNNLDIIKEEPDKMKPGYDPALSLSQTLDSVVVVKKDKKKKKKPKTFAG